jgi:hypothetical protein
VVFPCNTSGNQTKFDMIASACGLGIGLDNFIAMTRLARTSDSGAARFLVAWDALEVSEQLSAAAADAVCEQIGLAPLDLLKAVADATIRFSMYTARLRAAVAMPSIVERSIEVALTDQGVADRKMQLQHSGFLPTPAGSQTNIAIMQSNTAAQPAVVVAPKPEETIRRLSDRLNEARAKMNCGERNDGN